MITALRLIRNVGQFDAVAEGATLPLGRLTLLYADNGRGKTTICAIIRSLATGDPVPISQRQRLAATHPPHVVVECIGGPPPHATFLENAWNRTVPGITVFDDFFVDANLYSGLTIGADQRQRLHELILGSVGVSLNAELQAHVARNEEHIQELRQRAEAIPEGIRAGLSIDDFCALPRADAIDADIQGAERRLAAARERGPIRQTGALPALSMPRFDLAALGAILNRDLSALDAEAAARVEAHLATLGDGSRDWVASGMKFVHEGDGPCPFCAQPLRGSSVIAHYRLFFGEGYEALRQAIQQNQTDLFRRHGDAAIVEFQQNVRLAEERARFWSRFMSIPEINLNVEEIGRNWRETRASAAALLTRKSEAPLTRFEIGEEARENIACLNALGDAVRALNDAFLAANAAIARVKQEAAGADTLRLAQDVARLHATRARHTPEVSGPCNEYAREKQAKAQTEAARDAAKNNLERYRREVFPAYQNSINRYLDRFNAGFRIGQVEAADTRGGPTCNYSVVINNVSIPVAGAVDVARPSFKTTLSSGDRNALALAFFFAALDQEGDIRQRIVVIDDPASSLDAHRTLTTVNEIVALCGRVAQVIVLSHSTAFMGELWDKGERLQPVALQVARLRGGSTLRAWDIEALRRTDHDRRHRLLRDFVAQGVGEPHVVAEALRPSLEAYLRVACPEHFPVQTKLGQFVEICRQRLERGQAPILERPALDQLSDLKDYANRFHHDTNPLYVGDVANDGQLLGFVRRTLEFMSP